MNPGEYSDSSEPVQLFGLGYLFSSSGIKANGANLNMNIQSDINAPTNVYMFYDIVKTLRVGPNYVQASS